jgi:hypothetical protein
MPPLTSRASARVFRRHQTEIGHELSRIRETGYVAQFGDQRRGGHQRQAAQGLQRTRDRCQRSVRQHRLELGFQPVAPRRGSFDGGNAVLQDDVVNGLYEP